jgi:hypothetical protein
MAGDIQLSNAAMLDPDGSLRARAFGGREVAGVPELKNEALSTRELESFLWEIREQPSWRRGADKCADYYDNNQLDGTTLQKLKDRGQPPLITNIIKPTVDSVLGLEAKTRTDWKVNPEDDDEATADAALALSLKLKHAEMESRADRACSDAYAGQLKAGLGWCEVADEHDPLLPPYRVRYVHRREIAWDWRSKEPDLSDAKYLIRWRWVDLDVAIAGFPQYADLMRNAVSAWNAYDPLIEQNTGLAEAFEQERSTTMFGADWRDTERDRVCLYEVWYRKPVRGFVLALPNGTNVEYDPENDRHNEAILQPAPSCRRPRYSSACAWRSTPARIGCSISRARTGTCISPTCRSSASART